ncbi:cyclophilin-like domain-containing protein [Polychytrium aggregatum]|uniref:cyclophilin-like domain-containing protein n=1 Tax=Polychytrium aggregatum TaxID=110093 RepID=UPI0022FE076C|nr:cyclophilin-like domain-containing protein [Polychytrium aggregatum]KAI9199453.1 cyclophilin-like domain-containing protein [Polychytrium aggregatum]
MAKSTKQEIRLTGVIAHWEYQYAKDYLRRFGYSQNDIQVTHNPMHYFDFVEYRQYLKKATSLSSNEQDHPHIVDALCDSVIVQDGSKIFSLQQFQRHALERYHYRDSHGKPTDEEIRMYEGLASDEFLEYMRNIRQSKGRTFVFLDIAHDMAAIGRLTIELYSDICPKSVEHFLGYVKGKSVGASQAWCCYRGSKFTRCIKNGWLQAGEFSTPEKTVLTEPRLEDENFIVSHIHRGTLSFVNRGPHSNFSSFMISLGPMPYFDKKYVAFGRVIDGGPTLRKMELAETKFERPVLDLTISSCDEIRLS